MLTSFKQTILDASKKAKEGHIPSALSILDILFVLYKEALRHSPHQSSLDQQRDRFVLSKGHASLGLYAILAEQGYFPMEWFETFGKFESPLGGHPDRNKVPGVEASTGSLGHGFPMAVGIALAQKIQKIPFRTYVLVGDGEINEGTIWESALLCAHHQLQNLTLIVDFNHSTDRALRVDDLVAKFVSFGFCAFSIQGHDHEQIRRALNTREKGKPIAIIAQTIKGYGIKSMENNPAWHHKSPNEEEYTQLLTELTSV